MPSAAFDFILTAGKQPSEPPHMSASYEAEFHLALTGIRAQSDAAPSLTTDYRGFSIALYNDCCDLPMACCGTEYEAHFVVSRKSSEGTEESWPRQYLPAYYGSIPEALHAADVAACAYIDGIVRRMEAVQPTAETSGASSENC